MNEVHRPSRWAGQRADWYKDAARSDIRSAAGMPLYMLALGSLACVAFGVSELGTLKGWGLLAAGVAMGTVCWGLWVGYLWAGWIAGAGAAVLTLAGAASFFGPEEHHGLAWLSRLFFVVLWGSAAVLLLRPSSRAMYRQARTGHPPAEQSLEDS